MENNKNEILKDIRELISQIRERTELLESKLALLEGEEGNASPESVDIWDDDLEFIQPESVEIIKEEEPEVIPEAEVTPEPEVPGETAVIEDMPAVEENPESEDLPWAEEKPEAEESPKAEEAPMGLFADDEDLPLHVNQKKAARKSVLDAMENKEAWRTDVPGSAVKDVRSAISLNDRILFIRSLFNEDAVAFNDTLDDINSASSFDNAVEEIKAQHPDWKYDSDAVYRLMMAVRRRFR